MHDPECVQESEMHKIHWDFDIKTDHLISTSPSDNQPKDRELTELWTSKKTNKGVNNNNDNKRHKDKLCWTKIDKTHQNSQRSLLRW